MHCCDFHEQGRAVSIEAPNPLSVVSRDACKAALNITGTGQDGMIDAAIAAVVAQLDAGFGGSMGLSIGVQGWELQLTSFFDHRRHWRHTAHNSIVLPNGPLIGIDSVKYIDQSGVEQTLTKDIDFRVIGMGGRKQYIIPMFNLQWPLARCDDASVRVQYTAGYDGTVNVLPPSIAQAVCLGVRALLNVTERNLFISQDSVEGVGEKRYIVGGGAGDVINKAIGNLIANIAVTAL